MVLKSLVDEPTSTVQTMNVLHGWPLPIALSLLAFLVCLAIPRFRHYSLRALVIPMAFSLFAAGGGLVIVISLHELHLPVPGQYWSLTTLWLIVASVELGLEISWLYGLAASSDSESLRKLQPLA